MSGAEMLVLQQSVKQYILTRQTRELTDHELEEFEKLRSRLLPYLQRYSQSQSQLTPTISSQVTPLGGESGLLLPKYGTADISKRTITSSSQGGRLTYSQQRQQQQQQQQRPAGQSTTKPPALYPTTTSSARLVSTAAQKQPRIPASLSTTSSRSTPPVVASKPARQPLGNRVILQNATSSILHPESSTTTAAALNASRVSLVSNVGPKSDKKRPKGFTVYQDKENTPSKRRRLKGQAGHQSDSDKENQDPLAVLAAAANTTPRKTTVLGEKTNVINNVSNTSVGIMKGKEVLRDIVASKIVDMATTAPLAIPRTTKSKQQQQQKQHQQTPLYPSSALAMTAPVATVEEPVRGMQPASTRRVMKPDVQRRAIQDDEAAFIASQSRDSVVEEISSKGAPTQPDQKVSHGRLLLNVKQEPVDVVKLELNTIDEWPVEARSSVEQEIVRVPETPPRTSARVPETPPSKLSGSSQQIPASVEEEDSTGSFERYVKAEHADKKLGLRKPIIDFFEIPCSEASQESIESASFEETCPMPEFLLEGLPEDPQHDEAEVTLVDAVNLKQLNHRVSFAASASSVGSVSQSTRRNSTLESTTFADGLWCIEDMKHQVVGTICGFHEKWLALETTDHVQFWRLDNDTPSVKSQWVRYIHLPKSSSRSTQVLFAPDDSFAVVMDGSECSYTKVPLKDLNYLRQSDFEFPKYSWTGLKPSSGCKGCIAEQDSGSGHMIVAATEEVGSIGFIPVPNDNDNDKTGSRGMLKVKSVTVAGADESMNSLAMVGNTTLVAATFGPIVAICDVNSLGEPVTVVDTTGLSLFNPRLVYAAVPVQFFEKEKGLGMDRSHPATWPILAAIRDSEHSNQCAFYAMKGGHIERIHQYQGSSAISSACASSRFIACHLKANGKDVLQLWDITKPEPVIQLSLLEPPSLADVVTQRSVQQQSLWHQLVVSAVKREVDENGGEEDLEDLLSSVSTLSPPPDDLSSSPFPSIETNREAALPSLLTEVQTPSSMRGQPIINIDGIRQRSYSQSQPERVSRPPTEWIDLTSIAIMERKEISFSIHASQHWIVVVQKSSMMKSPSVVHILDLMSILYPSSTLPSP
ncbi:hypothetical protein BGZ96_001868 [Linnemannia gamsii]|uniref:WD40 repeat-like protein n=1 Tax=Linnemannia gamsii TaxID=64522 RepID=A0ABQ7KAH6_9FUNG|nr:hypothetical protein BGZ96_001868 [Linnemannia gamsii]